MDPVIVSVRQRLRDAAQLAPPANAERFFKEPVQLHGVRSAAVNAIAKQWLKEIRPRGKARVFALCDELWQSGYLEEAFIACAWSYGFRDEYTPEDFAVFQRWVSSYVSNWAACDTLCNHTVGAFIEAHPSFLASLQAWATADNRWLRRAAAVSLILPARHGLFLSECLDICDLLLLDKDDLVQKGYGWLLKAVSEAHQRQLFDFVLARKSTMPRTALRYAIEKLPPDMKATAMAR